MLTESSYLTAIYAYCGAAILLALLLAWWLGRRWPSGWATLLALLSAALLLTPAYPQPGAETMAPALIVAGFEFFLHGAEAAQHAIKPLLIACGVAVALALLLRLTVLRRGKPTHGDPQDRGAEEAGVEEAS